MANHNVTVHQLRSKSNKAFLNVDDAVYGKLEVWGTCYKLPVYLVQDGIRFHLFIFDGEDYAIKWLSENLGMHDSIIRIDPIEK